MNVSQGSVRLGTLTLGTGVSFDGSNTVGLPRQNQVTVRLDRFPIYLPGGYNIFATGIVQRLGWFGDRPSVFSMRGDLTAELPYQLALGLSVDRNPLTAVAGAGPWTTSIHLGRTTYLGIPAFIRYGSRKGTIYEDLNANGIRDRGEPGLGGVIIHRGDDYVTTDADGSFKFTNGPNTRTQRLQVDPRTLPAGWMDRGVPLSETAAKKVDQIAVVPTTAVRMHVSIRNADADYAGKVDLTAVVISAKDQSGRTYLAQTTGTGVQVFSALPPGDYRVDVDPSAAGQLQVATAPTQFTVGASQEGKEYDVELQTRAVHVKTFNTSTTADPRPLQVTAGATKQPTDSAHARPSLRSTGAYADTVPLEEAKKLRPNRPPPAADSTKRPPVAKLEARPAHAGLSRTGIDAIVAGLTRAPEESWR